MGLVAYFLFFAMQYEDDMHPKEAQDAAEKTALEELQVLYFSVFSSD